MKGADSEIVVVLTNKWVTLENVIVLQRNILFGEVV
jgi:hypothetical protein